MFITRIFHVVKLVFYERVVVTRSSGFIRAEISVAALTLHHILIVMVTAIGEDFSASQLQHQIQSP